MLQHIDPDAESLATEPAGGEPEWIQAACELIASDRHPAGWVPWVQLDQALRSWRAEGRFDRFNFVRKPPGLRLRFAGSQMQSPLSAWLDDRCTDGAFRAYRCIPYEPEVHRFGGREGMAIAHRLFDRDSTLLVQWETIAGATARANLSLGLVSDLAARCVDDGAEAWDVWMRLLAALAPAGAPASTPIGQRDRDAAEMGRAWLNTLTPAEVDLCRQWVSAHTEVAADLRAAFRDGALAIGPRSWLASACVFHWNRAGLTAGDIVRVLKTLATLWRPPEHAE